MLKQTVKMIKRAKHLPSFAPAHEPEEREVL